MYGIVAAWAARLQLDPYFGHRVAGTKPHRASTVTAA